MFDISIMNDLAIVLSAVIIALATFAILRGKATAYHSNLKNRIEKLEQNILDKSNELDCLRSEVGPLKAELSTLKPEVSHLIDIKNSMEDVKSEYELLQSNKNRLRDELAIVEADVEKKKEEVEVLSGKAAEYRQMAQHIDIVKDQIAKLEAQVSEHKKTVALKEAIEIDVEKLHCEVKKIQSEIVETREHYRDELNKIEALENQYRVLESQLKDKREENLFLDNQKKRLEDEIAAHNNSLEILAKRTSMLETLNEPPKQDDRLQDLYAPYLKNTNKLRTYDCSESSMLDTFSRKLRNAGLVFHERTIKAFHTSLKIADAAPLVVLAGISGTGKSLLPKLYSKVMGIHFLPIAVQPRWDSPQDLFGFYNYMENRFKATDLSRMLWQMDRFNNPDKDIDFKNDMVIVLLDEMNLARVEYYFSELLSKLELRRGIDPHNVKERADSEILIESGSLNESESNKQIFIDSNIMFVGTMNEDETTQSLSDKVIDRSNILRFGKPGELSGEKPDLDNVTADGTVNRALWKQWSNKSLNSTDANTLDSYVDNINVELEKINRPFGHRIQHAIKDYVTQYPGDFNDAVADQLELKIIPKLVGLDKHEENVPEVFDSIQTIIDGLGDDSLSDAFKKCRDGHGFFEWNGVNRI